jgi:CubicO group peptidase (beta-lactamase class C family)
MNTFTINTDTAGFSATRLQRITDHLNDNYIETGKIAGCQTLVARHGQVAYHSTLGQMDIERGLAMRDDSIFRIYSMTKPITSIALMQLFERGLFQLNDPIHRVIPSWRKQKVFVAMNGNDMQLADVAQPITFRHILSHTAGFSYGATKHPVDRVYQNNKVERSEGETLSGFGEKLASVPLHFEPGSKWLYSYATDICGHLVEALSGQTLDAYFQEHIFAPLGMTDTAFHVAPQATDRFCANYQRGPDKRLQLLDDPTNSSYLNKPSFFSGGGGLTSTTADYYNFCEMLRRGGEFNGARIIGSRTLRMMHQNHLVGGADLASMAVGAFSETAYEGVGFGLGFATSLSEVSSGAIGAGDYYWGGAASTIFWVDPVEDLVAIFMTQLMPSDTFNFRGQLKNIIYGAIED